MWVSRASNLKGNEMRKSLRNSGLNTGLVKT